MVERQSPSKLAVPPTSATKKNVRNPRRISIRSIPCEFEDGGVKVVEAIGEITKHSSGWVLMGYRDDGATLYLQGTGKGGVEEWVDLLRDDETQYVQCRVLDECFVISPIASTTLTPPSSH